VNIFAEELVFPPLSHILRWKEMFPSFNKVTLICVVSALLIAGLFALAGKGSHTDAPTGAKNFAESIIEFVQKNIVLPTIGEHGLAWTPFLLTIFCFVFLTNIPGVIPTIQMPANARLWAGPVVLAIVVWITFIAVGLKHQKLGYFGHLLWPPGVPVALKPLVGVIEFMSTVFVAPFSLAVRLFANLIAGHILLFTFSIMIKTMLNSIWWLKAISFLPFIMLVFMTVFEVLVAFLQAYIFSMLSAVYIGASMGGHGDDH
jgi:F-type H+-transporting ATPase subunit a